MAVHVLHDEGMHDVSIVDEADDHVVAAHVADDGDVRDVLKIATQLARTPENPKPEAQNPEKHQALYQHVTLFLSGGLAVGAGYSQLWGELRELEKKGVGCRLTATESISSEGSKEGTATQDSPQTTRIHAYHNGTANRTRVAALQSPWRNDRNLRPNDRHSTSGISRPPARKRSHFNRRKCFK